MAIPAQANSIVRHAEEHLVRVLSILILLVLSTYPAEGSPIVFTGSTLGAFNNGAFGSTATLDGLTFTGTTFVATTDKFGRLFLAGPSFIVGSFSLASLTGLTTSDTFSLKLIFDPTTGWNPNPMIVQATLFPNFQNNGLAINFEAIGGGPPFSFSNGAFTGTGTLGVGTAGGVIPGQIDHPIFGIITLSSVSPPVPTPEPATLVLLGTGIAVMALRFARNGNIGRNRNRTFIGQ